MEESRLVPALGTLSGGFVAIALFLNVHDERSYVLVGAVFATVLAVGFWIDRLPRLAYYGIAIAGLGLLPLAIDIRFPHRPHPMACDAGCPNPPINEWTAVVLALGALGLITSALIKARRRRPA